MFHLVLCLRLFLLGSAVPWNRARKYLKPATIEPSVLQLKSLGVRLRNHHAISFYGLHIASSMIDSGEFILFRAFTSAGKSSCGGYFQAHAISRVCHIESKDSGAQRYGRMRLIAFVLVKMLTSERRS